MNTTLPLLIQRSLVAGHAYEHHDSFQANLKQVMDVIMPTVKEGDVHTYVAPCVATMMSIILNSSSIACGRHW